MTETEILNAIRSALARVEGVTVWRNNSGRLADRNGRWVTYGLGKGSADLVGLVTVHPRPSPLDHRAGCACIAEHGPCDCGATLPTIGRFFALEIKVASRKSAHKETRADQDLWAQHVRSLGGFVAIVCSAEEAVAAVERCRRGESR